MSGRRLLTAVCCATLLGVPLLYSARAQSATQPDDCKRVYGGLGIAYAMCLYQRDDWSVLIGGSTYKLRNVAGDNVLLQFVRTTDGAATRDDVLIPYSAIRRVNIAERRRELIVVLTGDR